MLKRIAAVCCALIVAANAHAQIDRATLSGVVKDASGAVIAGATVTAIFLAFFAGPLVIARLKRRNVGQVIRADGPASHQSKRGTPTMGGLIILLATLVPTVLWGRWDNQRYVLVAVVATLWMGLIGFVDDYLKIVQGKSRGLIAPSNGASSPFKSRQRNTPADPSSGSNALIPADTAPVISIARSTSFGRT